VCRCTGAEPGDGKGRSGQAGRCADGRVLSLHGSGKGRSG
jgi:hypothetical protein